MDNQHKKIAGYRDLSQAEIDAMNSFKALGVQLGEALDAAAAAGADPRCIAIARTELQTGLMWAIRSVAKPGGF
jgi:hypothetical protein